MNQSRYAGSPMKGRKHGPETRKKLKGLWEGPEGEERYRKAFEKRSANAEWRKNNADHLKDLHSRPEWRAKIVARNKAMAGDPERSRRLSERPECRTPVESVTPDGDVHEFPSVTAAAVSVGVYRTTIARACRSGKLVGGLSWRLKESCPDKGEV